MIICCNQNCEQGRKCPKRKQIDLSKLGIALMVLATGGAVTVVATYYLGVVA